MLFQLIYQLTYLYKNFLKKEKAFFKKISVILFVEINITSYNYIFF